MKNKSGRIAEIDAIKGFAILLVVLGHSIQNNITDFDNNILFSVIYSFHMPLFMFVSGILAFGRINSEHITYLKKKFLFLVVPFLSWYFISYIILLIKSLYLEYIHDIHNPIVHYSCKEYIWQLIISPDYGLWFLWILFLNFCYLFVSIKFERFFSIYSIPIFTIILQFCQIGYLGIPLFKWYFVFFVSGYLVMRYKSILTRWKKPVLIVGSGLFLPLSLTWRRVEPPIFIRYLDVPSGLGLILRHVLLTSYNYIVPYSGIVFSFLIMKYLKLCTPVFSLLCWLGTVTIDIYVSHQLFVGCGIGEGYIRIITACFFSISLSLILSFFVLKRNKILSRLFLGKWS